MEKVAREVAAIAPDAVIVIKFTIPVGFVEELRSEVVRQNKIFTRNIYSSDR